LALSSQEVVSADTMQEIPRLVSEVSSGIVRLAFFRDEEQVGNGSGFLTNGLLVTNSHVIRSGQFDAVEMTFGDQSSNPITPVRYLPKDFYATVIHESPEKELDYAILQIEEPEFRGRFQFAVAAAEGIEVGEQVLFFGFPFGSEHLTSHIGYISAQFHLNRVHRLQIDGSINPGNSGGPLVYPPTGKAIAIVTRTQTGLEQDFDALLEAIERNVQALDGARARMTIGGIDPVQATRATMTILGRLAMNLRRSANVGIGYAFCTEHILETGLLG